MSISPDTSLQAEPPAGLALNTAPESIRARSAATLAARLVQMGAAAFGAVVVPRILGPTMYGNYNFLLATATTVRGFVEPSVQQAFFTFSAQDRRTGPLTKLYGVWLVIEFSLILGLIGLATALGITTWIWPGQRLDWVIWVTLLDWSMFIALIFQQLGDSKGLTVWPQFIGAGATLTNFAGLVALVLLRRLDFYSYIQLNLGVSLAVSIALGYWLLRRHGDLCWVGDLSGQVGVYLRRWWRYAAPLILYEYYVPLTVYLSTYLVQAWYGPAEQGYFGLATRWSALVLVFTSATIMIFWREIAAAVGAGHQDRAGELYLRFSQLLTFLTLALGFWLALSSRALVTVLAPAYLNAVPVLTIMAFYPVQQTFGQLNIVALKAAGRTAQYLRLSLLITVPDLFLTYVLLAAPTARVPGLGLGAVGVAWRLVGFGMLGVQAYEWSNARFFKLSYGKLLLHQLTVLAAIGACALLMLWALETVLRGPAGLPPLVVLVAGSVAYFASIGAVMFLWPSLIRSSRHELWHNLRLAQQRALAIWGRH